MPQSFSSGASSTASSMAASSSPAGKAGDHPAGAGATQLPSCPAYQKRWKSSVFPRKLSKYGGCSWFSIAMAKFKCWRVDVLRGTVLVPKGPIRNRNKLGLEMSWICPTNRGSGTAIGATVPIRYVKSIYLRPKEISYPHQTWPEIWYYSGSIPGNPNWPSFSTRDDILKACGLSSQSILKLRF